MEISGGSNNLKIDNCIFSNNRAYVYYSGGGGAVYATGGTFTNCFFFNNSVSGGNYGEPQFGGAVFANGNLFINCVFSHNSAHIGGAVYSNKSQFYNCTFKSNFCYLKGFAGVVELKQSKFQNCLLFENASEQNIEFDSSSVIINCGMESGNALVGTNGNIGLTSSPFKGGSGIDSLSLVAGPCVNAGTTEGITVLNADIQGNKRITGTTIDLGAYEFNSFPITSVVSAFTYNSTLILYPNPSKGVVYLNSKMLNGDHWELEVYDLLGHLVLSAPNDTFFTIPQAGIYQVKVKLSDTIYSNKIVVE